VSAAPENSWAMMRAVPRSPCAVPIPAAADVIVAMLGSREFQMIGVPGRTTPF